MELTLLEVYILFAVTTSLSSLYELVLPVIHKRKKSGKDTLPSLYVYPIFFILNTIFAPLVFLSCIVTSFGDRFRHTLYSSLYDDK